MQAIKQSRKSHKKLLTGLLVFILLAGVATTLAYAKKIGPFGRDTTDNVNYEPPTDEQKQAGADIKKQSIEDGSENEKPSEAGSQSESGSNSTKSVTVEVTNTPLSEINGKLTLNTVIKKSSASGSCTLVLSKSGQASLTKTAPAQVSGTVATCAGFKSIDVSELASGEWLATVSYKDANSSGEITEKVTL